MQRSQEAQRKILNVVTAVELEPDRYRQEWWASMPLDMVQPDWDTHTAIEPQQCGTAFCLAGWNHVLHHGVDDWLELGYLSDENFLAGWQQLNWSTCAADLEMETIIDFEVPAVDGALLISSMWEPKEGMTVGEALRALAAGATVRDITARHVIERFDDGR
jgi:hypothetical protein